VSEQNERKSVASTSLFARFHTFFIDYCGRVFVTGANSFGQLGLGDRTSRAVPTLLPCNHHVTSVSLGFAFSMIQTLGKFRLETYCFTNNIERTKTEACLGADLLRTEDRGEKNRSFLVCF
jgi:alpha-tubulin suppressor-like RCC1 family protein